ncbi:MAG: hypothetical protein JXM79_09590 [Sedimentisphaerales bacterium]|nr:hypothetical protein [Sedimentisphaerales bacterium]
MFRTFIQMSVMMLTIEASFFLLRSNLGLTAKMIAELGSSYWDYHERTIRNLTRQSVDTRVGLFLLLLSFALQLVNSLWPMRWVDFGIDWRGLMISIIFCVIILIISYFYTRYKSGKLFEKSMQIIKSQHQK